MVKRPVFRYIGRLLVGGVFKEEDDSIYLAELFEFVRVQRGQLVELYVFCAELLDEVCKDALWPSVSLREETISRERLTASLSIVFQPPDMVVCVGDVK
jgi:hypothetical protein